MYKAVSEVELLSSIRALDDSLEKIKLSSVEVSRANASIRYDFICDKTVDNALHDKILNELEKITPPAFKSVEITVKKIVSTPDLINSEIYKYVRESFPSIALFIKPTDVLTTEVGQVVKYILRLNKDCVSYAVKGGVIRKINEHLARKFCSDFAGGTEEKEAEESVDLTSEEVFASEIEKVEHRTIKVTNVEPIDDQTLGDIALYIEDATSGTAVVCGVITEVIERQTKNGKPYFIIKIDDTTARVSGLYFTKKYSLEKIRSLKEGDAIIAQVTIGEYKGRPDYKFEKINKCVFPQDFVKKDKYKKKVPLEYKLIFPEPAKDTVKVKSVFDLEGELPLELTEKEYVVFDLETTGTDLMSNGITEIGAVKLRNGKVIEQFTTLVKPDYPISDEIFKITGINEELVKDSPKISAVIPDFMKFISGAILVAHNAEFDMKFIKRFAGAEEYDVNNKVLDTLELSRKYLPQLKKHDLHTVADHFQIVFRHHRALSDAYATADAFIELMKIKNK